MTRLSTFAAVMIAAFLSAVSLTGQQASSVVTTVDAPTIAGRPVALDGSAKLPPWPMPDDTGYSYSAYFLSQWTVVWDQYNRRRLPYYYCCFDFDRTTRAALRQPGLCASLINLDRSLQTLSDGAVTVTYPLPPPVTGGWRVTPDAAIG